MAISTLAAIIAKVRRLTRSPSVNQLTDTAITEYVNTFIAFDFPEELRLFNLHTYANFQLSAYQATYDLSTLTDVSGETLSNAILTINTPIYIDGYKAYYSQSRDEFFNIYPQNRNIVKIGSGDGITATFTFTVANGFLVPEEFTITSIDATNGSLYVTADSSGVLGGDGTGNVDYVTGVINVTFTTNPGPNQNVNAHLVQYTPARPCALLFFQDTFTVRPIPDQPYTLNFEFYKQPVQLMTGDNPTLNQWWQYIAYGAAKKVFEDRMDMDSVQQIMPEFKKQERLVLRRTIVQNTTQRVATIYSQQSGLGAAFSNSYNGF